MLDSRNLMKVRHIPKSESDQDNMNPKSLYLDMVGLCCVGISWLHRIQDAIAVHPVALYQHEENMAILVSPTCSNDMY